MTDVQALLTEADKLARIADDVTGTYATELGRVLRDLERELRRLALDAIDGSKTALQRAVRAAKLRREIQRALDAAGYSHLAETTSTQALDRLVAQVQALRGAAKVAAFTTTDLSRIVALKRLAEIDLLGEGQQIAVAVWRTVVQAIYSQRRPADLLDDLATAVDLEETRARTLFDTTVSVFTRQVESLKSDNDPDEPFAYVGPVDVKIRPFCRAHVGKVYTRREIEAMDNGQLPNVFLTGGGYNCRHVWQAVSKFSALRNMTKGERIPEVAEALARVPVGDRRAA